ncbi:MAG: glycosyltransferase family 4 protein [Paracoccaceae bacterium]|nr:glycosyltransferase family 4 protein [Paracoccaceae bacterium]
MPEKSFAYLVPQFPGQTHIFFWREITALESRGVTPALFSTTLPPPGLIAHPWSDQAMQRTTYLASRNPLRLLTMLPRLPWAAIMAEARRLPSAESRRFLRDVLISSPAADILARSCKAQGITHVHAHSCGRAALIAALAHHAHGLGYSLTLHGHLTDYGTAQRFKWRHAAFVSVITQALKDLLPDQLGDALPARLPLQPMGVDTDAFRRHTPYHPPQPGEALRLFSCGRLNMVKGHQDLMQAVRLMLDRGQPVTLDIAGEDDAGGSGYRAELAARIDQLGLGDHVRLLGAISAEEVRAHLLSAHAFVLASWSEPLGVAYMEAMSCEVPTIGTAAGGVPELITDDRDGILVPPQDPQALADALMQLARDPDRAMRLSRAGRARVVEGFDSRRGADMLIREIWPQDAA